MIKFTKYVSFFSTPDAPAPADDGPAQNESENSSDEEEDDDEDW